MAQKNETPILVLALLITLGLVGGVYWWLARSYDINLSSFANNQSQTNQQSAKITFNSVKQVPSGLFSYGGSTTWAPIRKEADSAIKTALPK
ncbi:MAG: phosphate ABC transporter substrate-binding protein, partial [Cyanobacteria bacterium J06636_27]